MGRACRSCAPPCCNSWMLGPAGHTIRRNWMVTPPPGPQMLKVSTDLLLRVCSLWCMNSVVTTWLSCMLAILFCRLFHLLIRSIRDIFYLFYSFYNTYIIIIMTPLHAPSVKILPLRPNTFLHEVLAPVFASCCLDIVNITWCPQRTWKPNRTSTVCQDSYCNTQFGLKNPHICLTLQSCLSQSVSRDFTQVRTDRKSSKLQSVPLHLADDPL